MLPHLQPVLQPAAAAAGFNQGKSKMEDKREGERRGVCYLGTSGWGLDPGVGAEGKQVRKKSRGVLSKRTE